MMLAAQHRGIGMTSERTRARLIERLEREGVRDQRVLAVMRELPRHIFVEEALQSRAYEDIALPIGQGQTISQPYIVARMTELLLEGGGIDRVLEIGTGSGYQTAVLARLVPQVVSIERIGALTDQAATRLAELGCDNVRLVYGDGNLGVPDYAPYDAILVTAAPEGIPHTLIRQLRLGGRLVLPVGPREGQALVRVTRTGEESWERELLEPVIFVPMLEGVR